MQAEDDLLVFFLYRNKSHVGAGHRFTDRRSIGGVVLAALPAHAVGGDKLGGHELDAVAVLAKLPRPVVCAGAGFHANHARRQLHDQRQHLFARYPGLDQRAPAGFVHPMHREHVLGEIDSNRDNAHGLPLSWF